MDRTFATPFAADETLSKPPSLRVAKSSRFIDHAEPAMNLAKRLAWKLDEQMIALVTDNSQMRIYQVYDLTMLLLFFQSLQYHFYC